MPAPTESLAPATPKIALACDWLTTPGGAEKVLLELHHMYPDAPIYTSQYRKKGINWFDDAEVRTGWLQIFPATLRKFLGPLRQLYFSRLDLTAYDLVISVTGAEAKSLNAKTHLCYCHVPTQYYWQMYDKYVENPGFGLLNPLVRLCFKLLVGPLRKADYAAAQKPTQFITISTYAAAQIAKYYNRESVIIAPPVETAKFSPKSPDFSPENSTFSTAPPDFSTKTPNFSTKTLDKSTTSSKFSTGSPQDPSQKSTETQDFSTRNPQPDPDFSTQSSHFSTKDRELSTSFPPNPPRNPQKHKTSPQEIHNQTQTFPPNPATFPQLFHNFSTETDEKPSESHPLSTHCPPIVHPLSTQPAGKPHVSKPLKTKNSTTPQKPEKPFVISCRQVTWKRVDLAISACLKAKKPLLVIGDGPEHKNLVKLADNSPLITFIPWLDTPELAAYLQTARAYLFPSLEPFGIAAVEALDAGCPVIAYAEGGSRDFIHADGPGKNGLLFPEQTVESLSKAIESFDPADFNPETVQKSAAKFAPDVFRHKITSLVNKSLTRAKPNKTSKESNS